MTSLLTEAATREILQAAEHALTSGTLQTTEFESLTVTLRSLRADLAYAADLPTISELGSICTSLFCALRQLTVAFLTSDFPRHLDSSDGINHLTLSIALQCLCNLFSLAATNEFSLTAELVEPLIATLMHNEPTQLWILCLADELSLWRLRLATYSFTLMSHLARAPYTSVCSPGFFWLTARCMKRIIAATPIVIAAPDMLKLLQLWYDHCLSVVAGLSLSTQLPESDQGLTDLSAALGVMLLLQSEQDALETLASPPIKKLAASCLAAHLPPAQNSTALKRLISHCVSVLNTCSHEYPFCLLQKANDSEALAPTEEQLNPLDRVSALRGCIFILAELLSGDYSLHAESDSSGGAPPSSTLISLFDTPFLEVILSALNDCLVVIDSLLRASLSPLTGQNQRRKEPTLMDAMGVFDFSDSASVCYAPGLKQDLLRALLHLVHAQPTLIRCFADAKTSRPVVVRCPTAGGDNLLPEGDAFLALLNCTQRDPASPLAVEWAILLLRLLLNPPQSLLNIPPECRQAIADATSLLSGRLAQLEPCPGQASLKEQLKIRCDLNLP